MIILMFIIITAVHIIISSFLPEMASTHAKEEETKTKGSPQVTKSLDE